MLLETVDYGFRFPRVRDDAYTYANDLRRSTFFMTSFYVESKVPGEERHGAQVAQCANASTVARNGRKWRERWRLRVSEVCVWEAEPCINSFNSGSCQKISHRRLIIPVREGKAQSGGLSSKHNTRYGWFFFQLRQNWTGHKFCEKVSTQSSTLELTISRTNHFID